MIFGLELRRRPQLRVATTIAILALGVALLGGCAAYRPLPLPSGADLRRDPAQLKVDLSQLRLAPLQSIKIDPTDGIDPLEAAVLAVLNSPDLRAKRAALGIRSAEVFAAGLLPEPQITGGFDKPIAGPDTQTAYSISPSLDLAALLGRSNALAAARFTARQADLDLLWAEWTTAQQARQLVETAVADEARAAYLETILNAAAARYGRSSQALQQRDVTLQTTAADLAAKLDAETQLATARHDADKARRDLNALLNLDAGIRFRLAQGAPPVEYSAEAIQAALQSLPRRRPDLLALQAGYGAADAKVRQAVIAQFPVASIAYAYAKDPAGTLTVGLAAVSALPIFGNKAAEVRVQDATRAQLHAEYQARLDQTQAEARNAQAEFAAAQAQAMALRIDVPRLQALAGPALQAYDRGDIDSQTYLTLTQNVLARRADLDDKELVARIADIQLQTVLFLPPTPSRVAP